MFTTLIKTASSSSSSQGQGRIDRNSIDAVHAQPTKNIIKAAEQCLPRKKIPSMRGGFKILSKQVWQADKQWHTLKKEQTKSRQDMKDVSRDDSTWATLRQTHRQSCHALRIHTSKSRAKWLSNRLQQVSLFGDTQSTKHTWDKLKRNLGAEVMSGLPTQVRMATGEIVSGKEADEQWHRTRESISKFDSTAPFNEEAQKRRSIKMATIEKKEQEQARVEQKERREEGIMDSAIGIDEVKSSIQRASKGTAPGTDEVYSELLRQGGDYLQEIMHLVYNIVWAEGHGPEEWDCALVRPLYKPKAKDPLVIENYRAVTLINTLCKIYEDILCARVVHHLETNKGLSPSQAGSRRFLGCTEMVYTLISAVKHRKEHMQEGT